jgi:hypothetical protein
MTLPIERTNAVLNAEKFLLKLCIPSLSPRVPKAIREEARRLLRHYPTQYNMRYIEESFEEIKDPRADALDELARLGQEMENEWPT